MHVLTFLSLGDGRLFIHFMKNMRVSFLELQISKSGNQNDDQVAKVTKSMVR